GSENLPGLVRWLNQHLLLAAFVHGNDLQPLQAAAPSGPPKTFAGEDEFMRCFRRPKRDRFDANGVVFKTPGQATAARADGHRGGCGAWPEKLRGVAPGEGIFIVDPQAWNRLGSRCGRRSSIPEGGFVTRAIRVVAQETGRA